MQKDTSVKKERGMAGIKGIRPAPMGHSGIKRRSKLQGDGAGLKRAGPILRVKAGSKGMGLTSGGQD